jgi:hypothetical protein
MKITPENVLEAWERLDKAALPPLLVESHRKFEEFLAKFGWPFLKGADMAEYLEEHLLAMQLAWDTQFPQDKAKGKAAKKDEAYDWLTKHVHVVRVPGHSEADGKGQSSPAKGKVKPQPATEKAAKKSPATKAETKENTAKAGRKKSAPKPASADVRLVRDLDVELQLMRRFVGMNGKPRTRKQVLALLAALNRAITKGHIRKTDNPTRFHKEMAYIQDRLAYALSHAFKKVKDGDAAALNFDEGEVKRIKALVKSYAVYPSVRLALRFFAMEGKAPDAAKAKALLDHVRQAVTSGKVADDDPAFRLINRVEAALADYVEGGSNTVRVTDTTLEGLAGVVLGCPCKRRPNAR